MLFQPQDAHNFTHLGKSPTATLDATEVIATSSSSSRESKGYHPSLSVGIEEDIPWPLTQSDAFDVLQQLGQYIRLWYEYPRHSMQRQYGTLLIKHTLALTLQRHDFFDNLVWEGGGSLEAPISVTIPSETEKIRTCCTETIEAWAAAAGDHFAVDHKARLIPAFVDLSWKLNECRFKSNMGHSESSYRQISAKLAAVLVFVTVFGMSLNAIFLFFSEPYVLQVIGNVISLLPVMYILFTSFPRSGQGNHQSPVTSTNERPHRGRKSYDGKTPQASTYSGSFNEMKILTVMGSSHPSNDTLDESRKHSGQSQLSDIPRYRGSDAFD
eukprot:PhF_6_TR909/c2_g1_i1/m.1493